MRPSISLLDTEPVQSWLRQFSLHDQRLAADLLEAFCFISRDEFATGLKKLVISQAKLIDGPIALYTERELDGSEDKSSRLFYEPEGSPRRAYGNGPLPIQPSSPDRPEVGSEGIVAQLITELCRREPKRFINHPGPDLIRKHKVRALWVLTDFVGSGKRAYNYLSAAWRIRSIRSWNSGKFIQLGVIAYAMTPSGQSHIKRHPCRPLTAFVQPCPTIFTAFRRAETEAYVKLCKHYDPIRPLATAAEEEKNDFLGFLGTGALIAFAHGAPNNCPRIFHKTSKRTGWIPLFPARVTADLPTSEFGQNLSSAAIAARLRALGNIAISKSPAALNASIPVKKRYLVLTALSLGQRGDTIIALRTGLSIPEVEYVCNELEAHGWIGPQRVPTDAGLGQLRYLRRHPRLRSQKALPDAKCEKKPYYPISLRAPVISSS